MVFLVFLRAKKSSASMLTITPPMQLYAIRVNPPQEKKKQKNNTLSELLQNLIAKSEIETKFSFLTHGGVKLVIL